MMSFTLNSGATFTLDTFTDTHLDAVLSIEKRLSISPWSKQNFIDSIQSYHLCYVALAENAVAAYAIFSLVAGEAELLLLGVNPDYQRRGIAEAVMTAIEPELQKRAQEIFLEVRESNEPAINLYEKLDFHCIGRRPNYYPTARAHQREDALIYAKHIGEIEVE